MLGINPGELTARNSEAYWALFHFGDRRVQRMARHTGELLEKWAIYLYVNLVQNIFAFKAALKKILDLTDLKT